MVHSAPAHTLASPGTPCIALPQLHTPYSPLPHAVCLPRLEPSVTGQDPAEAGGGRPPPRGVEPPDTPEAVSTQAALCSRGLPEQQGGTPICPGEAQRDEGSAGRQTQRWKGCRKTLGRSGHAVSGGTCSRGGAVRMRSPGGPRFGGTRHQGCRGLGSGLEAEGPLSSTALGETAHRA